MLILNENSYDWALRHAETRGDTDVFPLPFEYAAIRHDWERLKAHLGATNVLNWTTRPARTLLAPKAKYGFRPVTQLDPLDFLIYSALVYEVGADIEAARIPTTDNRVFSYRYGPSDNGDLFQQGIGYRHYVEEARRRSNSEDVEFVATADISDFYARIYHHRLENALRSCTKKTSHVTAIMDLLSGWNGTETFGIPVGSAASRLLAEIALTDVDEALLAQGVDFIRFNDDYRIFAPDLREAYEAIAFLAETLYRNHGLSLQQHKTSIFDVADFRERFLSTPLDREMDSLHERFERLLEELGLEDWYEPIEYDDLTPEQQREIDALNLSELLEEELQNGSPDVPIVRFVLRRLAQLGDDSAVDLVLGNIDEAMPAFSDVIHYFRALRHLDEEARSRLGNRLLDLLEGSVVSALPYHRMWILDTFTHDREWDNEDRFFALYNREPDQACRRKLILAMGRASQRHWFQSQWRNLFDHPHWARRAVIAAGSCLPGDARRHWYRSLKSHLDVLEESVAKWARQNPFGG